MHVLPASAADSAELRKARGAFFTPDALARYVTDWAVRSPADAVLEPSCGEAAFLLAVLDRWASLHASADLGHGGPTGTLDGVELHEDSARAARQLLHAHGVQATVRAADFFSIPPTASYDAVIGNPPYIRYQQFTGPARAASRAAALRAGVKLSGLASSWAAFTVHAALFLRPGGRLGLVLPAELLSVNYAAEVRRFLLERFANLELVLFDQRVFPGVSEDVVLVLADGYGRGPAGHADLRQVQNVADLASPASTRAWRPTRPQDKWTPGLLPAEALAAYGALAAGPGFVELEHWGDTTLGTVTGNNKYFTLSSARVAELGLGAGDVVRLSPPGSRHLRGLELTDGALDELGRQGSAVWLFRPGEVPSAAAAAYIDAGHKVGVDSTYKCRTRRPWWRVPLSPPADLLLTYLNADTPRLTANLAGAHNLNSVHGVYLREPYVDLGRSALPVAALNSLTLLGAETVGRAYGGGVLKLEPGEADRLPVPAPGLVREASAELASAVPAVTAHLAAGQLLDAAAVVDGILLSGRLGVDHRDLVAVRDARSALVARRVSRGAEPATLP